MNLQTSYLGFRLPHPFVPGACPLADSLDTARRMEDAGAPMIVLRSLFAEQIVAEQAGSPEAAGEAMADSVIASHRLRAELGDFAVRPDAYLEHIRQLRHRLSETTPIVASLNVTGADGWFPYVRLIDEAGANALELNIYSLPSDLDRPSERIERDIIRIVGAVKRETTMPLAIKLLPFYTSLANFAHRLGDAGANGLILFNRLYQPDINIEAQQEQPMLTLSSSSELMMRLRWMGILSGRVKPDLALTGGVHHAEDAVKAIMCGASVVQIVSVLLEHGVDYLRVLRENLSRWLETHGHESLDAIRGSMSLQYFPNPEAFERGFYMHLLQTWQG